MFTDAKPTPHRDEKGRFAERPKNLELTGEQSGEQVSNDRHFHDQYYPLLGSLLYGNGGNPLNPMAFPAYDTLYLGRPVIYRWMLQHPVVRLVRAIATADILCNRWEYMGERPDEVDLVKQQMDENRLHLLTDYFMRGRDFGWQGGEPIWEIRGTKTWLARVKPLIVDYTDCLRDELGNFSGLINRLPVGITSPKGFECRLSAPFKAWKYTYDSEAGYLYGRSWLENIRMTAWRQWLDCAQQLQKLKAKISGIQLILTCPAGTYPGKPDPVTGKRTEIEYRDTGLKLIQAIARGAPGAVLPGLNIPTDPRGNINTAKVIAELMRTSLIKAELLNHGTNTPAIEGILKEMQHHEEMMFAGGLCPPSVGMNDDAKANVENRSDTRTQIAQLEDQDFAMQCQPLVDAILVLNFGPTRRGKVRIVPPSMVDNKRAYFKAFLLAAMNDPIIAREMLRAIDVNTEMENIDIRMLSKYDPKRVEKADQKQQQNRLNSNKQPDPQGGRPKKKEGGNPKRRPTKSPQK